MCRTRCLWAYPFGSNTLVRIALHARFALAALADAVATGAVGSGGLASRFDSRTCGADPAPRTPGYR